MLADRIVGPEGFRQLLERLGPTFIKIGQFLALRPDILPQEYSDTLLRLLDNVEPFAWSDARLILEQDLGDYTRYIESINSRPIAAGSLAQVHLARTRDGERVAVKILRPGIRERLHSDLRRIRLITRLLRMAQVQFPAPPEEIIAELTQWLNEESNLTNELSNLTRLYELTRRSKTQVIPRPFPEMCGPHVLTAAFVRGTPLSELIMALDRSGPREVSRRFDLDLDELAQNLVEASLRQVFRYHFFHADVHPGNLFALPGNAIGYLDFGLCQELDETVRRQQVHYLSTVYNGNVPQMFKALLDILVPTKDADEHGLRTEFVADSYKWLNLMDEDGAAESVESRSPTASWLIDVVRAARHHHYHIPPRLLAMYRTLLTAETVAHRLSARMNLRSVGRDFFYRLQYDEALDTLRAEATQTSALQLSTLLHNAPGLLNQLLGELNKGRFRLKVQVSDDANAEAAKNRRAQLLFMAIGATGLAFLLGPSELARPGFFLVWWLLAAVLAALYVSIVIQWRRMK